MKANPRIFVYAAGGYYYPGQNYEASAKTKCAAISSAATPS